MKRIKSIITILVLVILLTGCSLFKGKEIDTTKPYFANCSITECIKTLTTTDNIEKINKVMGFEGELINEGTGYKTYKWYINKEKNEALQAVFYSNSTSLSITLSDQDIKNDKVDFSKYEEIKKALNNKKELKYIDIRNKLNAEGTLIEKTKTTTKYRWVNGKGRYINATFNTETGACTMIFGMI